MRRGREQKLLTILIVVDELVESFLDELIERNRRSNEVCIPSTSWLQLRETKPLGQGYELTFELDGAAVESGKEFLVISSVARASHDGLLLEDEFVHVDLWKTWDTERK